MLQTSTDHQQARLLALAADHGRDVKVITEILEFLDAHPKLIDLPRVLQGLLYALDAMEVPPAINLGDHDLRVWKNECTWLIKGRDNPEFITALGSLFYNGEERRKRNPIIGNGVQDHAFPYALLWHEPTDLEGTQDYYRLVGQLLASYQQRTGDLALLGQRYSAYLDLRALCARQTLSIPSDLNIWSSSLMFANGCQLFDANTSVDLLAEHFRSVIRLIRYFGGNTPPARSGGGGNRHRGSSNEAGLGVLISQGVSEFPLEDPDDPDLLPGYISFAATLPLSEEFDEALPVGEITPQKELCLIDTGVEIRPFVADLLGHQGMLAHITRERQFLPFSYNLFTLSELANLLFGVTDEFLQCRERIRNVPMQEQKRLHRRLEALLVIHLMLWFGRSVEDCKKLRIAERNTRPSSVLELIPADEAGPAEFRFFVVTPDYSAEEKLPSGAVRASQETISVPDLVGAASLVLAVRELAQTTGTAVLTCKVKDLEREVRILLSELGGGDSRYTMHKVRSHLHRRIIADTHDVVAATMLSGMPCLSANTALYYSQYNTNYLRNIYCQSVQKLLVSVYACADLEAPVNQLSSKQGTITAIGARNCLRLSTVKENIDALLNVLRKRKLNGIQQLVHWHNCFTLWTVLMFLMGSGCRAIRNPLKQAKELDPYNGQGALGDKGADDGHMSRFVTLPEMLNRQLRAYTSHCHAIRAQFKPCPPSATASEDGFFLQINDKDQLSCEEIRPLHISTFMRKVTGFTPHPVNAFRKLLRTELAERGCSTETIAAFMGHWLNGEEPQGIYSGFCPRFYVQNLHDHVLPIMKEVGWTMRHSPFVSGAKA